MSAYDHWKQNDFEGERRQAEADADWEAFEEWSQGVDDAVFADWCRSFFDSLKAGTVLREAGWKCFEAWLYEKRWPAVRQRLAA